MKASNNPTVRRVARAVVTGTIVAATMAVAALPALADTTMTGEGNSPGDAANEGRVFCYAYTTYNSTEVLRVWRYVDSKGATRFRATVRCYHN